MVTTWQKLSNHLTRVRELKAIIFVNIFQSSIMLKFEGGKYIMEVPAQISEFVADVMKYMIILLTYHIMLYSKDGRSSSVSLVIEQSIYLILGIAIYWFIFDKLIIMKSI